MSTDYIYALVDPRDDMVSYVGATNSLMRRFYRHVKFKSSNREMTAWLNSLQAAGLKPKLRVLEAPGFDRNTRERYWMRKFYLDGHPVKNSAYLAGWTKRREKEIAEFRSTFTPGSSTANFNK